MHLLGGCNSYEKLGAMAGKYGSALETQALRVKRGLQVQAERSQVAIQITGSSRYNKDCLFNEQSVRVLP